MSTNVARDNNPIDCNDAQTKNDKIQMALELAEDSDSELVTLLVEIVKDQDEELQEYRKENELDKADIRSDQHNLRKAVKPAIGMAESQKLDDNPEGETEERIDQQRESSLEQICGLPEDMAHKELTMNMERARYVALRITSFGTNTQQGGFSLKSSKLKRILDDFDMSGHTQTVTRVMDFLKEFGRSSEVKTKINEEGVKLVWFDIDLVRRLSQITPDSESTGENTRVVIGGRG